MRGELHRMRGDFAAALADVDQSLVLDPANEAAKAARGEMLKRQAAAKP